jgi:signal transduction histidine kinase
VPGATRKVRHHCSRQNARLLTRSRLKPDDAVGEKDGRVRPSLTVYRVGQEALTNIRKHARPERVELILRYDTDGTRLTTRDHAERSSPANATSRLGGGGYGLTGMRERAELLGGSLEAGHTRVELWIAA